MAIGTARKRELERAAAATAQAGSKNTEQKKPKPRSSVPIGNTGRGARRAHRADRLAANRKG